MFVNNAQVYPWGIPLNPNDNFTENLIDFSLCGKLSQPDHLLSVLLLQMVHVNKVMNVIPVRP